MEIVIDIPKETYEALVINQYCGSKSNLENIIVNGTPLPKHHGRLIDADKLPYEDIESVDGNTYMCVNAYDIEHASTIIEAEGSD